MAASVSILKFAGLVYGCTLLPDGGEMRLYQRPWFWAAIVFTVLFVANLILW